MGLPRGGLVIFFSYDPACLYPETYPDVSTTSTRPALPFPRPVSSKRSLCDPVNLVGSVRRDTVGEATALYWGQERQIIFTCTFIAFNDKTYTVIWLCHFHLPSLLQFSVIYPQSPWRPLPLPPPLFSLCTSSWPAHQVLPWTRQMWWYGRISS